jgi:hypothetical protein
MPISGTLDAVSSVETKAAETKLMIHKTTQTTLKLHPCQFCINVIYFSSDVVHSSTEVCVDIITVSEY